MDFSQVKKHLPHLLLLAIMLVGAVFRFGWAGTHSYSFDEARVSMIALKMVFDGEFARLGMQSSVGVPNFPATVWLYAIPYAIFGANVQMATWFTGFVALLAIPAVYTFGRLRWGVWGGLSAALLFSLSPYMLVYGRNIWSQNFLAPLTVFWLLTGYKGILPLLKNPSKQTEGTHKGHAYKHRLPKDQNHPPPTTGYWSLVTFIFLGGFIGQVHIAGLAFALPTAYLFLRFRLWRKIIPVLIGGMAAVLAAFPALYTIWRFGDGARADLNVALAEPSIWHHNVWRLIIDLPLNLGWEFHWLGQNWEWSGSLALFAQLSMIALAIFLIVGIGLAVKQTADWFQSKVDPADSLWLNLVLGALLATPLLFWYSGSDVAIHYLLPAFPAGILLIAGAAKFERTAPIVFAIVCAISLGYATQLTQGLNLISKQLAPGGMGTPLAYPQAALETALNRTNSAIVVAHSDQIEFEGDPATFYVLGYEHDVRLVDGRSSLIVPAEPVRQLFTFDFVPAWSMALELSEGSWTGESARRMGEPPYPLLELSADQLTDFVMLDDAVALANGATLVGYRLNKLSDTELQFVTRWTIAADSDGTHTQQFNHLYIEGAEGTEGDSAVIELFDVRDIYTSSRAWRDGDTLITWATFTVPEGTPIYIHTGMYTLPTVERIPKLGEYDDPLFPIQIDLE
ncbi:MAG: 4-amino-4-deoxy-L-arabinose transferase-like glycosyltransferase [Cellvibrionaceae bacterium]